MMLYRSYGPRVGDLQPEVMPEDNARMRGACRRIIDQFNDEYDLRAKSRDAYNAIENPITTPHAMSAVRMLFVLNKFEIDYVDKCIVKEDRPIGTLVSGDTGVETAEASSRERDERARHEVASGPSESPVQQKQNCRIESRSDERGRSEAKTGPSEKQQTSNATENQSTPENLSASPRLSVETNHATNQAPKAPGKPRVYSYRPRVTTPSANGIIIAADALGCDTEGLEDFDPKQSVRKKYSLIESDFTAETQSSQRNAEIGNAERLAACVSERDEALDGSTVEQNPSSNKAPDHSHPRTTNSTNADGGASGSEQTGNSPESNRPYPTGSRPRLGDDDSKSNNNQKACNAGLREQCSGTELPADSQSDDQEQAGGAPAIRTNGDSASAQSVSPQRELGGHTKINGDSASQTSEETCSSDSCRLRQPHGAHSANGDLMAERDAIIAGAVETLEHLKQRDDADAYRMMEFQCKTALHHLRGDPKPPDPVYKNDGTIEQFEQIMELVESGASEQEISRRLNIGSSDPDPPDTG